jgi:2-desacetyl-2-hydroxyethyl bacteriochlorophyllide A dehydrogenase
MRAVIMDAPTRMRVGEWEAPKAGPGEVVVAVAATGICVGDLYIYRGDNPYASFPVVGGHEIAGTVAEVGQGVTGVTVGARVVVEPFLACGVCYACRVGKSNCCSRLSIVGVHRPGGFAEYVMAPATHVHPIPDGLSMTLASFAEPIAIAVHACRRGQVGKIEPNEYALVLGCGPIGLALIEVAKARGARVVATDLNRDRLQMAATLGAETLMADDTLLPTVLEQTGGDGAPVILEATGSVAAMESTPDLVAAGGRIVLVGLIKRGVGVTFPGLDFTRKEMSILGSRASVKCFPEALDLLASGRITYPKVATEFPMWEAPTVFASLYENPATIHKGVLIR